MTGLFSNKNRTKGEAIMKSSVFVRVDRYRELSGVVSQIRTKLEEAKQALRKMKELKSQEDNELASWQSELSVVEQKLSTIREALTEQRG